MLEVWNVRDVGCSGCGMFGIWDVGDVGLQDVGCSGCGMLGMWDVRDVGCGIWDVCRDLGYGMFAGMWDIDLQNAKAKK